MYQRRIFPGLAQHAYSSLDAFLQQPTMDGVSTIVCHGIPLDVLAFNRKAKKTVVFFHGAIAPSSTIPVFVGNGLSRDGNFNRISISDPIFTQHNLTLGWHAGFGDLPELSSIIFEIVASILFSFHTTTQNLLFVGASGGGFAALNMSRLFPRSTALVMNPQTDVTKYRKEYVTRWCQRAWGVETPSEIPSTFIHDMTSTYRNGFMNDILYMQNRNDKFHIKHHLLPFLQAVNDAPRSPTTGTVHLLSGRWGDPAQANGHVAPPKELISATIDAWLNSGSSNDSQIAMLGFAKQHTITEEQDSSICTQ